MATAYQLALGKDWDEVETFCKQQEGFSLIFPQTPDGDTLFHLAAFSKSKGPLEILLEKSKEEPMTKSAYSAKNIHGNTALHEAAADGNIEAIKLLLEHDKKILEDRNMQILEVTDYKGESWLPLEVTNDEDETTPLLEVTNNEGETPLFKAAAYGQIEVVRYLLEKICIDAKLKDIHRQKKKPQTSILHAAIQGENFETALALLEHDESLATLGDGDGRTSFQLLATMPSAFKSGYRMSMWKRLLYCCTYCPLIDAKRRIGLPIPGRILKDKSKHTLAFELTKKLIDQDTTWVQIVEKRLSRFCLKSANTIATQAGESEDSKPISEPIALFLATERGIVEIVYRILDKWPQLAEYVDDGQRNMLHIAIMHRQKEIFDLVKEMNIAMKKIVRGIDEYGYTILHHAADMTNDNADIHQGPAYHLQEELKWYKRVEKLVPTHFAMSRVSTKDDNKEDKNCNRNKEEKKYNCKELFDLRHKELLKDAQKWVKETSQSCSAVAVLVATVVFAAAYTVPGGFNEKGYPVFLNNNFFMFFTIMDVFALACSLTSVVMFLSVLTSPFNYEEFLFRLPRKLTIGFALLFVALTTTMLAFAATLLLIVRYQKPYWTITLIYTAAFFPVSIFALTQFSMYLALEVTLRTFCKRIKKALPRKWSKKLLGTFKATSPKFYEWIKKALPCKQSKKLLGAFLPVKQFPVYVAFKATLLKFCNCIKKAIPRKPFKKQLAKFPMNDDDGARPQV